jgi:hypothetical protein
VAEIVGGAVMEFASGRDAGDGGVGDSHGCDRTYVG